MAALDAMTDAKKSKAGDAKDKDVAGDAKSKAGDAKDKDVAGDEDGMWYVIFFLQ